MNRISTGLKRWPSEITYDSERKILHVVFVNNEVFDLPAEYLRVESPSAEVRGHSPDEKQLVYGRRHVSIIDIEQVGNYAVRLVFDDLHDSGIYSWSYLYELGRHRSARWTNYLEALEAKGYSREP